MGMCNALILSVSIPSTFNHPAQLILRQGQKPHSRYISNFANTWPKEAPCPLRLWRSLYVCFSRLHSVLGRARVERSAYLR
jgi:hypothetical protein